MIWFSLYLGNVSLKKLFLKNKNKFKTRSICIILKIKTIKESKIGPIFSFYL